MKHEPVTKLQHRPLGCGHGFGLHTPPETHVVPPVHIVCVNRRHVPSAVLQHAPGAGHVLGVQVPPADHTFEAVGQSTCSVNTHEPVMKLQHRPVVVHGLGLHTPPCVHDPVQRDCVSREHAPFTQHEPVGGHVFGVHVPPIVHTFDAVGQFA